MQAQQVEMRPCHEAMDEAMFEPYSIQTSDKSKPRWDQVVKEKGQSFNLDI